jgi:hypothetical protein
MKKWSKTVSKTTYLLLSAVLLISCGNVVLEGEGNAKEEKEEVKTEDIVKEENIGDGSLESENISFFPSEAYQEIGLKNPPQIGERGERFCGTFLNEERMIELITFSPWMDTGGEMLFSYILNEDGTSWDRQPVLWTEGLKGKIQWNWISVLFGQDHNYYAYYYDEAQTYHMVKREGESCVEIVIKDWEGRKGEYLGELTVLACGNIVMVDTVGNCYVYSPDGSEVLAGFRCGWCETLCVSEDDIFILDHGSGSVLHYDGKALKMLPSFEGDFTNISRLSVFEDTLYVCDPKGIFSVGLDDSVSLEKARFLKWIEAGNFHFSKENGYPLDFLSLGESFYLVYAEEWGRLKKYVPREKGKEFLDTLTVYSLEKSELIIDMIAEFKIQYPKIDVCYETGEGGKGSTLLSDHIRALNTRILAGDGPDILVLDGLPAQSYVKKGILADLSVVLSDVLEELQENIVSNYWQGNQIYMLPLRYMIPMIATSGQNAQIFNSLSNLVAYCEAEEGNNVIVQGVPYSYVLELLYFNFPPQIISEDGSVNKENLLSFIHLAERFCEEEGAVASEELAGELFRFRTNNKKRGYFDGIHLSMYKYGTQTLDFINMAGIYELSIYPQLVKLRGGALLGNKGIFFPNGVISVNAHTKKKELAYQFIKGAFSYDMQQIHSSNAGFSLYKKVLVEDASLDYSYRTLSSGDRTLSYFNRKDAKKMIEIAKVVQVPVERNQPVFKVIQDAVCACLCGEQDEEATLKEIVERVQLYYFE